MDRAFGNGIGFKALPLWNYGRSRSPHVVSWAVFTFQTSYSLRLHLLTLLPIFIFRHSMEPTMKEAIQFLELQHETYQMFIRSHIYHLQKTHRWLILSWPISLGSEIESFSNLQVLYSASFITAWTLSNISSLAVSNPPAAPGTEHHTFGKHSSYPFSEHLILSSQWTLAFHHCNPRSRTTSSSFTSPILALPVLVNYITGH